MKKQCALTGACHSQKEEKRNVVIWQMHTCTSGQGEVQDLDSVLVNCSHWQAPDTSIQKDSNQNVDARNLPAAATKEIHRGK